MTLNLAPSDITYSTFFCGAGGDTTGAVEALGNRGRVVMAANHWQRAIETHQINHPNTDHDLSDLQLAHPSRFPRTTIAWFSPECTNHSLAKGRKRKNLAQMDLWGETSIDPAEERSRATMREVVEFSEYHRYDVVIVENVVDIRHWMHYDAWLTAMHNLGYMHRALYLNAMFFDVPQSRDRIYIVFWKKGNPAPDLDFHPRAWCREHGWISAVQSWKGKGKQVKVWGRYGDRRQYVYRCPLCAEAVKPPTPAAAQVIDWSLPSERIRDRKKPLKPKTMDRIRAGLKKFTHPVVVDTAYGSGDHVAPVDQPLATQTTRQTMGLAEPFIAYLRKDVDARSADDPLLGINAGGGHHALIEPFLLSYYNNATDPRSVDEPAYTIAGRNNPALTIPPILVSYYGAGGQPATPDQPLHTIPGNDRHALITPFVMAYYGFGNRGEDTATSPDQALPTIPTENRFAVVQPFLTPLKGNSGDKYIMPSRGVDEPLTTLIATASQQWLVDPFLISTNHSDINRSRTVVDPMPTIMTQTLPSLVDPPTWTPAELEEVLMESGFRMLTPPELKLGMSFPETYIITGNLKEQTKQIGNAVCPEVAKAIIIRCVESLA